MSQPKLIVVDAHDRYSGFSLGWFFPDEGEEGGHLGESIRFTKADIQKEKDNESREHVAACVAASKTADVSWNPSDGYTWESRAKASAALRSVKEAIKNLEHPWPEWAIRAKQAGWKEPKGWKP